MTFCLQISLSSGLWLPIIDTALSSKCSGMNVLQKVWMLKKPCRLWLAASRADVTGTWRKVWATTVTSSVTPPGQEWTSPVPSIAFVSPCSGCNIWLTGDPMASGTWSNLLSSSQPSQLFFLTCGYFMLCNVSSSFKRANGRNLLIFWNSEVQPAFVEDKCPSHLYFWVATSYSASQSSDLLTRMVLQKWEFFRLSWKGW